MKRHLLFFAEPTDGGDNTPAPEVAPPPAAKTVLDSDATEGDAAELVRLKRERDEEKSKRTEAEKTVKQRETRIAELEDENRRLKTPPTPAPVKEAEKVKKGFLEGATFFG